VPEVSLDHVQIAAPEGCEAAARRFFGELVGRSEDPWGNRIEFLASTDS
jgi:hypothetical protein